MSQTLLLNVKIFSRYKALKEELASATTEGEELLSQVRKPNFIYNIISHVAAVERYAYTLPT